MRTDLKLRIEELKAKIESVFAELAEKSKELDSAKMEIAYARSELNGCFSPGYRLQASFSKCKQDLIELVTSEKFVHSQLGILREGYFKAKKDYDEFKAHENALCIKVREGNQRIESLRKRVKELTSLLAKHRQSVQFVKEAIGKDTIMDTTP